MTEPTKDVHDQRAEELLPCSLLPGCTTVSMTDHNLDCCVWRRHAVAAALREQAEKDRVIAVDLAEVTHRQDRVITGQAERIKALEEALKDYMKIDHECLSPIMGPVDCDSCDAFEKARAALEGK